MCRQPHLTAAMFPQEIHTLLGPIRGLDYPVQGETSDVVFVESAHGSLVIKRAYQQPYSDWLRREYHVLRALAAATALPIPRVYTSVEQHTSEGDEHWLVMARLAGQPLQLVLRSEPDPSVRRRLFRGFGEVLGSIHRCSPPPILATLDQPWLDSMLRRAADYLQHYPVDGTPALLRGLEQHRPQPITPTLIHGDYMLDNVLVTDGSISGVIDWAGGAVGDPRYDLALATQPRPEAFQSSADLEAFYDGYEGLPITAEEAGYFVGLYEFF
jgi:aminoglycoside phosphotransferase (APT) family kinase protein